MDWGTLAGWIGTIAGAGVGLLGGVVGTYFSIKNTKGPRERAFMIKASVICWIFVFAFITGMAVIPGWYNLLLGIPYTVLLIFGILKSNQVQLRIRKGESGEGPVFKPAGP